MKTIAFHMQGYRDLPADFNKRYDSIWVTPPNDELCDPAMVGKYFRWNIDELLLADELGFDGVGVNEHHQNGYGFSVSPNLIASILAERAIRCRRRCARKHNTHVSAADPGCRGICVARLH